MMKVIDSTGNGKLVFVGSVIWENTDYLSAKTTPIEKQSKQGTKQPVNNYAA